MTLRRRLTCPSLAALLLIVSLSLIAQDQSEKVSEKSAEQWLALIDAGNYDESWNQAGEFFRSHVTKEAWNQQVSAARGQTGKFKSRKLKSAQAADSLPNAPVGKYEILQYDSSFNAGPAVETVVLIQEKAGSWKVVGYFVKPA